MLWSRNDTADAFCVHIVHLFLLPLFSPLKPSHSIREINSWLKSKFKWADDGACNAKLKCICQNLNEAKRNLWWQWNAGDIWTIISFCIALNCIVISNRTTKLLRGFVFFFLKSWQTKMNCSTGLEAPK